MSFQTFCGQDPNDAVSYRKVLPQFIAENSATTSVLRINNSGATPLRKPSVNNEALTIVETYSQGKAGFSVDVLPNPPEAPLTYLNTTGCLPYKNGAETGYLVYGGDSDDSGAFEKGQIFKFVPNVANPAAGVWTLLAECEAGGTTITSGCQLSPTSADGGEPADGALFIFCGLFTQVIPVGGAAVPAVNFIQYNSATGAFTAVPFAHPITFTPRRVFGIPATLAAVGTFIILGGIAGTDIVWNAANYGYSAIYEPAAGGNLKYIGGNAGDSIGAAGSDELPNWCSFDNTDRLWVGGNFYSSTIGGVANNSKFLLCLSAAAGVFSTIVALPPTLIVGQGTADDPVMFISNSYDGSKIVIAGGGSFPSAAGNKYLGFCIIDPATFAVSQPASFAAYGECVFALAALYIDDNNYAVSCEFRQSPDVAMYGSGQGGALTSFASGLLSSLYEGIDWYFEAIDAGKPLSYISFNYNQGSLDEEQNAFSGSYSDAAATSTLVLQNGAVFRHIAASGAYKDAPSATINTQFATLSLIGDTAANAWDVIGYTGTITFNDA